MGDSVLRWAAWGRRQTSACTLPRQTWKAFAARTPTSLDRSLVRSHAGSVASESVSAGTFPFAIGAALPVSRRYRDAVTTVRGEVGGRPHVTTATTSRGLC